MSASKRTSQKILEKQINKKVSSSGKKNSTNEVSMETPQKTFYKNLERKSSDKTLSPTAKLIGIKNKKVKEGMASSVRNLELNPESVFILYSDNPLLK